MCNFFRTEPTSLLTHTLSKDTKPQKKTGKTRRWTRAGQHNKETHHPKSSNIPNNTQSNITPVGIVNLSNHQLTNYEISLLNKGLKFAPTNKPNKFEIFLDLQRYIRKLTLKKYFIRNPITERPNIPTTFTHTDLKPVSKFNPYHLKGNYIQTFESLVIKDLDKLERNNRYTRKPSNLNRKEIEAIKDLQNNMEIVVKPADKGGAIVIMNLTDYNNEAYRILTDEVTYVKLQKDPTLEFGEELRQYLQSGRDTGILTQKEFEYLNMSHPKIPFFYFLPKIHKNHTQPPGRPIISGISSITSNLSKYIDTFLQKYVNKQPSHLRDTTEILQALSNIHWENNMWLVTCDVMSLYTVINHEQGIHSINHFLSQDPTLDPQQADFILNGILYILKHNYFWFNNTFYLQRQGTAMGTRFAPSYANLFMSWWEANNIFAHEQMNTSVVLWRRYIDDIIFIWKGPEIDLTHFISQLNHNSNHLQFTTTYSKNKVEFLDLEIYIEDDHINTKTFHKPVDVNSFILATSNHHPSWLASIPSGQFRRIRRNCTDITQYKEQSVSLKSQFLEKGYPISTIEEACDAAEHLNRDNLLKYNNSKSDKTQNNKILFITQYNNKTNQLKRILQKHWHILQRDDTLAQCIGPKPEWYTKGLLT